MAMTEAYSIYDQQNLIQTYCEMFGEEEVPMEFNFWACISMVAACLQDRVWVQLKPFKPIYPNLYTMLVGPSGCGKGVSIGRVESLVENLGINYRRKKQTAPNLIDDLSYRPDDEEYDPNKSKVYLAHPEAKLYLGKGENAETFIEFMTEMYDTRNLLEGTRATGNSIIQGALINWIVGSTPEWLVAAVGAATIQSGFYARAITCKAASARPRLFRPQPAADYEDRNRFVQQYVQKLSRFEGEMVLTRDAEELAKKWYESQVKPDDEGLLPSYNRQKVMMLKLSIVVSVTDCLGFSIEREHVKKAITLAEGLITNDMPDMLEFSARTVFTLHEEIMRDIIRSKGEITRSELTKIRGNKGLNVAQMDTALKALQDGDEIEATIKGKTKVYLWCDNH